MFFVLKVIVQVLWLWLWRAAPIWWRQGWRKQSQEATEW